MTDKGKVGMNEQQIARRYGVLKQRVESRRGVYLRAKARRMDKGDRIQSAQESRANTSLNEANFELAKFRRENNLQDAD